jgi:formylglycine-generating enzyme required for sulfatase activity
VAAFSRLKLSPEHPPSPLDTMLSRGIDPLVLDPEICHSHPEIPQTWPTKEELTAYAAETRESALKAAKNATFAAGGAGVAVGGAKDERHAVLMALEHERMHQETLCYMLAQQRKHDWLANNSNEGSIATTTAAAQVENKINVDDATSLPPFFFNTRASYLTSSTTTSTNTTMVTVPGSTTVSLGINPVQKHGFVWDNELGTAGPFTVNTLSVATNPVTVAEFYDFVVNKGGYSMRELWEVEDFDYFKKNGHEMPATWSSRKSTRSTNTTTATTSNDCSTTGNSTITTSEGEEIYVHMPEGSFHWKEVADCPVYCSLAEATAYCKLHKGRIMTEHEYQNILIHNNSDKLDNSTKLVALEDWGWEWTSTAFASFSGFAADPLYPEYSVDFFDGCHYVLKGSCPYTHPSIKRASFRNYYQRQYRNMFAKFRLVKEKGESVAV